MGVKFKLIYSFIYSFVNKHLLINHYVSGITQDPKNLQILKGFLFGQERPANKIHRTGCFAQGTTSN